ncbi:Pyrroline-5-carboxylate reductase [Exophiala dermatitidis]
MAAALRVLNGSTNGSENSEMTVTFLGCGTLNTAILTGILSSLQEDATSSSSSSAESSTNVRTPSRFIACVRRPESAQRIQRAVQEYSTPVTVLQNENVKGVKAADVVILGCKPYMVESVLAEKGIQEALAGKLLVSISAGVPVDQIGRALYGAEYPDHIHIHSNPCRIVRVMPNTAAMNRESMTVIATSTPPLPSELSAIVEWIFTRIGRVVHLPPSAMDASTALCGSGPAFCALMLESLVDGAVAMGIPRQEAQLMAAQTMRGTSAMVLAGEHPAFIREKVSTPGGCTIGGLLVLEEGAVRGTISRSIREATVVASELGKGVTNVNGTRFSRQ